MLNLIGSLQHGSQERKTRVPDQLSTLLYDTTPGLLEHVFKLQCLL